MQSKSQLANLSEGDNVLVERETFFEGEKLCLRYRGPRRVIKALCFYIYRVEALRTGDFDEMHGTRLNFYRDNDLDDKIILSHVLT